MEEFKQFIREVTKDYISSDKEHLSALFLASNSTKPVLILGPTGTGKEMVANAIHKYGILKNNPFVAINCALIPKEHLYGELFGVEGGKFTGISKTSQGYFEAANGGTIFLDEIGDLPLDAQAGLLRVVETGRVKRLGEDEKRAREREPVKVRLISATNKDIAISNGFRNDLYYRLKVIPIFTSGLESRRLEIPFFLKRYLGASGIQTMDFHFYAFCLTHDWKGNIRELKNFCDFAALTHIAHKVYLFRVVESFFGDSGKREFSDPSYFKLNTPFELSKTQKDVDLLFHHSILDNRPMAVELVNYLEYIKHFQENDRVKYDWHSRQFRRMRKLPYKVKVRDRQKRITEIAYRDFAVHDLPEWNLQNEFTYSLSGETDENRRIKEVTILLCNAFRDYEESREKNKSGPSSTGEHYNPEYRKAFETFEANYYTQVFGRFRNLSDNKIARLTGRDPKTVKQKREQYSRD